jgi:hypothetical protein
MAFRGNWDWVEGNWNTPIRQPDPLSINWLKQPNDALATSALPFEAGWTGEESEPFFRTDQVVIV